MAVNKARFKDRSADDFEFIMLCLKHTPNLPKPDFAKVAANVGSKNVNTCYHRHWRLMNEWGMTKGRSKTAGKALKGVIATARKTAATSKTAATRKTVPPQKSKDTETKKRKRPRTKRGAKQATGDAEDEEDEAEDIGQSSKRVKGGVGTDGPAASRKSSRKTAK